MCDPQMNRCCLSGKKVGFEVCLSKIALQQALTFGGDHFAPWRPPHEWPEPPCSI